MPDDDACPENDERAFLRFLASGIEVGSILYFGQPKADTMRAMLGVMDITTKLLAVTADSDAADALRADVAGDLRVSVHSQDLAEFLTDIEQHLFSMVVLDEGCETLIGRVMNLVVRGGVGCGLNDTPRPPADEDFIQWVPAGRDVAWAATRRVRAVAQRRGGRRGRPSL
jgi:hypothetical protein